MIKATGTLKKLELTADGSPLTTLQDGKMSFEVDGRTFAITRKGVWGPTYELWLDKNLVVSAKQTPMFNTYTVTHASQVWQLKAIGLTAAKFGLLRDEKQVASISPVHLDRCREVVIDLPPDMPAEVQAFLMWIVWWKWSSDSSS